MGNRKLKPCPFCGGEAYITMQRDSEWYKEWYSVVCGECGSEIKDVNRFMCDRTRERHWSENLKKEIEKSLTDKWNRRAENE